jgi:DNA-binding transcriptional MerR regulator
MGDLIGAGEAADILGVSPERVRQLAEAGKLQEQGRFSGRRVYRRQDVERLKRQRAKGR